MKRATTISKFTIITAMALLMMSTPLILQSDDVAAHPPSDMTLSYDIYTNTLTVTVTHSPHNQYHYVESITVFKNGVEYLSEEYESQSESPESYEFQVMAVDGDNLSATAVCNLYGDISEEITVRGPKDTMELTLSPTISSIGEGESQKFIVNIYSDGEPVSGAELDISVEHGTVTDIMDLGIGGYEFNYTAGSVEEDTDELMNVTANKNGYHTAYSEEMSFTILDSSTAGNQLLVSISPNSATIEEGREEEFKVTVSSPDSPVGGAAVDVSADLGDTTEVEDLGGGDYSFYYSAPRITEDREITLTVSAQKTGYLAGSKEIRINILDLGMEPTLDGVVSPGEYSVSTEYGGGDFVLHWTISGDTISIAMVGMTEGYVAVGFDPEVKMKGADMIIGWVEDDGDVLVFDTFGEGETGPHPMDEENGGTYDILALGGRQADGYTTIEFQRKLDTGDPKDKPISRDGETRILWALSSKDSFSASHGLKTGYGTFNEADDSIRLWPVHALFMVIGITLMAASVVILYTSKKKSWWFKAHKSLAMIGGTSAVIGLLIGIYMVEDYNGSHFSSPHSWIGLLTILLIIAAPIVGFLHPKMIKKTKSLRSVHIWISRIAILLMAINILLGLSAAGVL